MPLLKEEKQFTYANYLTYPEEEKWEIINGIPYRQAAPAPKHQEILKKLSKEIEAYLTGKSYKVYPAPFCVRIPKAFETDSEVINVVEPDISICEKFKIDDKGCWGAPAMIIEIVSPSSIKIDRVAKYNLYQQADVREYWIVEPEEKLVSAFHLLKNRKFSGPEMYTAESSIQGFLFPDLVIDLEKIW